MGLKSRLPNTSIIRHQARPAPAPGPDRMPGKPARPGDRQKLPDDDAERWPRLGERRDAAMDQPGPTMA